jgi:hypothetical protein
MKKLIFLTIAVLVFSTAVSAQVESNIEKDIKNKKQQESILQKEKRADRKELRKLEGKEVSYQAKQQFISDFGDIPNVQWERTANFDEAIFTKDGKISKAFYDVHARLVGSTSVRTLADLPPNAQKFINEKYKDYTIVEILLFDDNELNETDLVIYGEQIDDEDSYFVELKKGNEKIVLQVDMEGFVYFFKNLV